MNKIKLFCLLCFTLLLTGCEKLFIKPDIENTTTRVFDHVWEYTKNHYCCFDLKEVNWDNVYQTYSSRINDDMEEDSLHLLIHQMLSTLEDEGIAIVGELGTLRYETDNSFYLSNLDTALVSAYYAPYGYHGTIISGDVAYMSAFDEDRVHSELTTLAQYPRNEKGLIMDFRNFSQDHHSVSYDTGDEAICNPLEEDISNIILCPKDRHIGSKRLKNGAEENDYSTTKLKVGKCSPGNDYPIIVLCNRETYGGSNRTVFAMSKLPNVTLVGAGTGGGNIAVRTSMLPNGWLLNIPTGTIISKTGYYINYGIEPDVYINDDPATTDIDEILEKALELLE